MTKNSYTSPERLSSGKMPLALLLAMVSIVSVLWHYTKNDGRPRPIAAVAPAAFPKKDSTAVAVAAQTTLGRYTDGSYTGEVADAFYGTVQVEALIRHGALAEVAFLRYPGDRSTSIAVNKEAMPVLIREAIAAQSAQVDTASGATFTSEAFRQSLASALTQATN